METEICNTANLHLSINFQAEIYLSRNWSNDTEMFIDQELNEIKAAIVNYGHLIFKEGCKYVTESSQQLAIGAVFYLGVCVVCYISSAYIGQPGKINKTLLKHKRVLVVTAHPDDECMFFGPVILKFSQQRNCRVYLLCLSTGNFDGLGSKRKEELYASCRKLGIKDSDVTLYQSSRLPDDPGALWPADVVGNIVLHHVESLDVEVLITFDKDGVSGHPNHSALYYAAAYLFLEKKLPTGLQVFCLESTSVVRKYWSLLDVPVSQLLSSHRLILSWSESRIVQGAMKAHASQMVWFRRLYLLFSRYLLVNTLQRIDQDNLELDLSLDE